MACKQTLSLSQKNTLSLLHWTGSKCVLCFWMISVFQVCSLYKHLWEDGLGEKRSQCFTHRACSNAIGMETLTQQPSTFSSLSNTIIHLFINPSLQFSCYSFSEHSISLPETIQLFHNYLFQPKRIALSIFNQSIHQDMNFSKQWQWLSDALPSI